MGVSSIRVCTAHGNSVVPVLCAAALGYVLLRGAPEGTQAAALAFMAGVLLPDDCRSTLPQGDEPAPPRMLSTVSFAAGFAVFAVISAHLK